MYHKFYKTRMRYIFHPLPEDGFITPARWQRLSLPAGYLLWQRYLKTREPFAYYLKLRWPHAFQRYLALHRRSRRKHPVLVNKQFQHLFETLCSRNTAPAAKPRARRRLPENHPDARKVLTILPPLIPSGNAGVSPAPTPNQCTIIPFPQTAARTAVRGHQPEKNLFLQNEPNFQPPRNLLTHFLEVASAICQRASAAQIKPNSNPNLSPPSRDKPNLLRQRLRVPPNNKKWSFYSSLFEVDEGCTARHNRSF